MWFLALAAIAVGVGAYEIFKSSGPKIGDVVVVPITYLGNPNAQPTMPPSILDQLEMAFGSSPATGHATAVQVRITMISAPIFQGVVIGGIFTQPDGSIRVFEAPMSIQTPGIPLTAIQK